MHANEIFRKRQGGNKDLIISLEDLGLREVLPFESDDDRGV
jgi:hypothetical protein